MLFKVGDLSNVVAILAYASVPAAAQQGLAHIPVGAGGQGDDPLGALRQPLPAHP